MVRTHGGLTEMEVGVLLLILGSSKGRGGCAGKSYGGWSESGGRWEGGR